MNEVQVILRGWDGKRDSISGIVLYAENGTGQVRDLEVAPAATEALLKLPDGEYLIFALFTTTAHRYCAESDNIIVPCAGPIVLDLDQAGIDEVLIPPP